MQRGLKGWGISKRVYLGGTVIEIQKCGSRDSNILQINSNETEISNEVTWVLMNREALQ